MKLYISPIALAAGVLSMDQDFRSFIPTNFGSFIALVFVFAVLGVILYIFQLHHTWCWELFGVLAGKRPWDRKIRASLASLHNLLQIRGGYLFGQEGNRDQRDSEEQP
jgi:hypothetical protein